MRPSTPTVGLGLSILLLAALCAGPAFAKVDLLEMSGPAFMKWCAERPLSDKDADGDSCAAQISGFVGAVAAIGKSESCKALVEKGSNASAGGLRQFVQPIYDWLRDNPRRIVGRASNTLASAVVALYGCEVPNEPRWQPLRPLSVSAPSRIPLDARGFVNWCATHGLDAVDPEGLSCNNVIQATLALTAAVNTSKACSALVTGQRGDEDLLTQSIRVFSWLRANQKSLRGSHEDALDAALRAIWKCECSSACRRDRAKLLKELAK